MHPFCNRNRNGQGTAPQVAKGIFAKEWKMKRLSLSLVLVLALAFEPAARPQQKPEPQFFTCIMTWMVLGIFVCCAITCYMNGMNAGDYTGPTNSPPLIPPHDDDPPATNTIPTNFPPIVAAEAWRSTQHLDVRGQDWSDCESNAVTDLYRLSLQSSGDPRGPWTNAYTVTLWQSAYGSTALVEDGAGNPLATNYARRGLNGSVTNLTPVELDFSAPQKFWRAKP